MVYNRYTEEYYTHNNLKTYDLCKRRYYYEYVKKLKWPSLQSNYEFGLTFHKLLDYQARGLDVDIFLSSCDKDIKDLFNVIKAHPIMTSKVIKTEWAFNFSCDSKSLWIDGRIDRLIYGYKDNLYTIVDFKTGQNIPNSEQNDWQSIVYLYGISEALNILPDRINFVYFKIAKECKTKEIIYSSKLKASHKELMSTKLLEIKRNKNWLSNDRCHNLYCQYKQLCQKEHIV